MRQNVARYIDKNTNTAKYVLTVTVELEIAQELEDLVPEASVLDRLWRTLKREVEDK